MVLPDSKNPDEVSVAVQSFLDNGLSSELLVLLEKLLLHSQEFQSYKKLQNLLIFTAMKTERGKVIEYINLLNNYDIDDIANALLRPDC